MKGIYSKLVVLLLLLGSIAYPQIPRIINYQGLLLGTNQQPVPDGNYDIILNIYDEPGSLLWTETHTGVVVKSGLFQVLVGSNKLLDLPFDQQYFLGIKVGDNPELVPRMLLTSAAYSFTSANAEAIDSIKVSKTPTPNTLLPLDATGMFPTSVIPSGSGGGIGGSGTVNYLPLFTGTTTLGNSVISQTSGNLGIGTTTPTVKFELAGSDAKIYGLTIGRGKGGIGSNTALGYQSLYSNTTGTDNVAVGLFSLYLNTTGKENTAVGSGSLNYNTAGEGNTAVGFGALYYNVANSSNTAIGYRAMYFSSNEAVNPIFTGNTAIGYHALEGSDNPANNTGYFNTAIGTYSLQENTSGNYNSALGHITLLHNTNGYGNSAFGSGSLASITAGNLNSAFGVDAGVFLSTGSNNTFIGANSGPSSTTVSNEITLGDNNITSLRCNVTSISSLSDVRDKKNIRDFPLGLDFLMTVKPRLFNWDRREWYEDGKPDGSKMQQTPTAGFIAQELDTAQINANAEWLNLVLKSNPERFEATAGNLLPIMVKAIQDLKTENDLLRKELELLKGSIAEQIKSEVKSALLSAENTQKSIIIGYK